MAGYTRQDTANNIANGNVIDADDLDIEFNGVEAAFSAGSGHKHDGTTGEGAPITVIGPSQDIVSSTTVLRPKTTNTVDLGTTTIRYKDAYLSGDLYVGDAIAVTGAATVGSTLSVTGNTSVGGNLTVTGNTTIAGNTTLGDAATDTVSFAADVSSSLVPAVDDTYDLGAVGSEWRNLYIDGTANIDTAAIDVANLGSVSVSGNGTVTGTLAVTGGVTASLTGNASTASALSTARTITLAGDVSGAANFDGTANITITATVADDSHNHVIANVDGLQTALDGKAATVHTHAISDVTNLQTTLDGKAAASHTHTIANVTGLQTALDGKAALSHTHAISDVTGLQTALDGKAALSHTHAISDVTGLQTALDAKLEAVDLSAYTGDVDIAGELVVDSYNETYQSVSSTSNATTVNCEAGNVFATTLTESTTFTFSNPPASGTAYGFSLRITQDASASGYVVTWPAAIDWPSATAPTLTSTASGVDQFVFYTNDGGTTWYGFVSGQAMG